MAHKFLLCVALVGILGVCHQPMARGNESENAEVLSVPQMSKVLSEEDVQTIRGLVTQAELALSQKEYAQAIAYYDQALALSFDVSVKSKMVFALNEYAVCLSQEKKYLEALFYLQKAVDYADEKEALKKNIAVTYTSLGLTQLEKKDYTHAVISYRKAQEYDPDMDKGLLEKVGFILFDEGVKRYNTRAYQEAQILLENALEFRVNKGDTYQVLGLVQYYQQQLGEAESTWQKALACDDLKPELREQTQRMLKKVKEERAQEEVLSVYKSDYFTIRYDKKNGVQTGYQLNDYLKSAYREIGRSFNYFPKTKIVVLVYDQETFLAKSSGGYGGVRAMYDGKLRLPVVDEQKDLTEFKSLVWHEYVHALLFEIAGPKIPLWMNEGLAQVYENKVKPIPVKAFIADVKRGLYMPFQELMAIKTLKNVKDVPQFYVQSFMMMTFLLEHYQLHSIKKMMIAASQDTPIEAVLKTQVRTTPEHLERKWLEWIKRT